MLLPHLQAQARNSLSSYRCIDGSRYSSELHSLFFQSSFQPVQSPFVVSVRHATHGKQGRANGPKSGPGKRLGAKKTGEQYVIPGNIIFRQRGTVWFPGENCGMGRDHTIFALKTGYVKYYRDPRLHPKRQYIGVVFERNDTLPYSPQAPRKRRLGMVAVPRTSHGEAAASALLGDSRSMTEKLAASGSANTTGVTLGMGAAMAVVREVKKGGLSIAEAAKRIGRSKRQVKEIKKKVATGRVPEEELHMRDNYMYRESNWEIGRAAERAGIQVKPFRKGDRFLAWRKRVARVKRNLANKQMAKGKKKRAGKQKTPRTA